MKILLDENLPRQLKADFGPDYDAKSVRDMGWLGKKNGELLGLIVFTLPLIKIYVINKTWTALN